MAPKGYVAPSGGEMHFFNIIDLVDVAAKALTRWCTSFKGNPDKFTQFVERYDRVISDRRPGITQVPETM